MRPAAAPRLSSSRSASDRSLRSGWGRAPPAQITGGRVRLEEVVAGRPCRGSAAGPSTCPARRVRGRTLSFGTQQRRRSLGEPVRYAVGKAVRHVEVVVAHRRVSQGVGVGEADLERMCTGDVGRRDRDRDQPSVERLERLEVGLQSIASIEQAGNQPGSLITGMRFMIGLSAGVLE